MEIFKLPAGTWKPSAAVLCGKTAFHGNITRTRSKRPCIYTWIPCLPNTSTFLQPAKGSKADGRILWAALVPRRHLQPRHFVKDSILLLRHLQRVHVADLVKHHPTMLSNQTNLFNSSVVSFCLVVFGSSSQFIIVHPCSEIRLMMSWDLLQVPHHVGGCRWMSVDVRGTAVEPSRKLQGWDEISNESGDREFEVNLGLYSTSWWVIDESLMSHWWVFFMCFSCFTCVKFYKLPISLNLYKIYISKKTPGCLFLFFQLSCFLHSVQLSLSLSKIQTNSCYRYSCRESRTFQCH